MATKFEFTLDEKVMMWTRNTFTVEAETEEEAIAIAKKFLDKNGGAGTAISETDDPEIGYKETEYLYETEEPLSVEENGDNPTQELYLSEKSLTDAIATNA